MIIRMSKDFDVWNNKKKQINDIQSNRFHKPREVWWCYMGVNVGYEQDGGKDFRRPVVILNSYNRHVCLAVPLTASQKQNKYHFYVGDIHNKKSFAIITQLKLIDSKRLIRRVAILDEEIFLKLKDSIKSIV
jgi:mRNA interferase MazF